MRSKGYMVILRSGDSICVKAESWNRDEESELEFKDSDESIVGLFHWESVIGFYEMEGDTDE